MTDEKLPIDNLPESGLKVYDKPPQPKEGDNWHPNTVLLGALDELEQVSIVGRLPDGTFYFASSLSSASECLKDVKQFKKFLKNMDD